MREIVRRLPSAAHSERGHRRRAARIGALMSALALTGAATVACTPPPSGPTAQEQFCTLWDKVGADEVAADNAVLVKSDVVAFADGAAQVGSACDASGAKVELDAAVLAEGKEIAEEQGTSSTDKVAAVTGDEIGAAEPVLDNIELRALNAQIGVGGITVTGNVAVRLSGTTSTIGFTGTVSNLDNWSVSLASSGLTIPGVTTSPVVFSGKLAVAGGVPTLTMSASASTVKVGDITVTGAAVSLTASQNTGVSASVKGAIKVGPSSATGNVAISFDEAGALVSANADVSARLVGTQAGGKKIDLTGTVHLEGNATETAYTPFLSVEGAGEFSGTLDDGTAVAVAGNVSTEIVGGQVRSVVTGNFKIGTLKANGTAVVQMSGATTTLEISADLDTAGFTGRLEGAVVITDGRAETVQLDASVSGALTLGDITLTNANFGIRSSYGNPLELSFGGAIKVGNRADLNGSLAAAFGPNGTLITLEGDVNGSLLLDSWGIANFSGHVLVGTEQVALSGTGRVTTTNFPLGIEFNGTFTSSRTTPSWSLSGGGRFRIGSIDVASARMTLSQAAGMKATRVGFYFSIIGIPTYLEADFYMNSGGGCSKVQLTGGSFLARPIASLILPGVVGCSVYN